MYDKAAITELRKFFATQQGLIIAGQNSLIVADRARRLTEMGVPDVQNPILGETYVELNECQMKVWHPDERKDVIHVVVTANANQILMDKPLLDILGVNFFTWTSWGDDPDATDYWMDSVADITRVPNQVANAYLSQIVENGLMRGYGMNYYDATKKEGWTPIGYNPSPFGFYPLPGKPQDVLQHVEIPELASHMEEMTRLKQTETMATATPPIESGNAEKGNQTLGEIQLMIAKADELLKELPKFSRLHAVQLGTVATVAAAEDVFLKSDRAAPILVSSGEGVIAFVNVPVVEERIARTT